MEPDNQYAFGQNLSKAQVFILRREDPVSRKARTINAFYSKEAAEALQQKTPPRGEFPDYLYILGPTLDDLEQGRAYDRVAKRHISDSEIDEVYRLLTGRR